MEWPITFVDWRRGHRIIPSRFPSINLFERVADAADFEALYAIEEMTNPRIRDEIGQIELVPTQERLFGPGASPIMAAFTHLNPNGSRFSDGSYGVFYLAKEKETAIAETRFHSAKFLAATSQPPIRVQMRQYHVHVKGDVFDLMQASELAPGILAKDSYAESQTLGAKLRNRGANGLTYPSVRHEGGQCIAAFRPTILSKCFHAAHLEYHWDGSTIDYVTQKIASDFPQDLQPA